MAAVNFFDAFGYKWGQTGNTVTLQDDQYKVGWSFIGDVPPSVEQFNEVQQLTDEKANWLYGQLQSAAAAKGVTLSSGDLSSLLAILDAATPAASTTVSGLSELATNAETQAGTDDARVVTPAGLSARTATETRTGLIELATSAETLAGSDAERAVTPATLSARTSTESRLGILSIASNAEAQAWTNDAKALTPRKLAQAFIGANAYLSSSGYQRLPGGLLIQWRNATTVLGENTTATFPHPIAFPNACLAVVHIDNSTVSAGSVVWSCSNYNYASAELWWRWNGTPTGTTTRSALIVVIGY